MTSLRTLLLFAVASLGIAAARAESYSFKEPFTKSSAFKDGATLALENVNGSVQVLAWNKGEILIEGEKSAETEEELKQIDLTMDVTDARAQIKVKLPKRNTLWGNNTIRAKVTFTIHVPAATKVDGIDVVNSSLTLEGITGPVKAESVNGSVHATGLAGNAALTTVNGSIRADFATVLPDQKLKFKTVNGAITLRLPPDAGAVLHASVVNGSIATDFALNGTTKINRHHVDGTVGDGRAQLEAHTVNGGIKIAKR